MRIAVIDLGTNTFHLLIAEVAQQNFDILYKTNVPVKLGEGRINENMIIPAAFNRGIACLEKFAETIKEFKVEQLKATATSAVRSAKNGKDFVEAVLQTCGISIEVISGDDEAELIYQGVKLSGPIKQSSLIMDIGGGSVEFIFCDTEKLLWKKSYNIGAARLAQQFFKSDPINDEDKNALLYHIQIELAALFEKCEQYEPKILIGSAGAFETFAELIIKKKNYPVEIATAKTYAFNYDEYIETAIELLNRNHSERAAMKGMIPLRVDMIVMATLITNYVLGRAKINEIILSTYDLKMGSLAGFL
ncbi:exopolyphosphatase [Pedobacter sp. MC2016-05]|uniref:Ppx/GppA phosphatase family protein n=1 Tax=Pedobacter sp. MC2016-05 TaxID=2994474 RepID=UPI002247D1B0|nr:exopolyphosphatase [Pedobacter sp. MC2016-05]MCX2475600.1 exopolyphosphatase [Pedobacter sp. MC2016-05]